MFDAWARPQQVLHRRAFAVIDGPRRSRHVPIMPSTAASLGTLASAVRRAARGRGADASRRREGFALSLSQPDRGRRRRRATTALGLDGDRRLRSGRTSSLRQLEARGRRCRAARSPRTARAANGASALRVRCTRQPQPPSSPEPAELPDPLLLAPPLVPLPELAGSPLLVPGAPASAPASGATPGLRSSYAPMSIVPTLTRGFDFSG